MIHPLDLIDAALARFEKAVKPAPAKRAPRKRKPRPMPVFRSTRAPKAPVALLPAPAPTVIEMPAPAAAPKRSAYPELSHLRFFPGDVDAPRYAPADFDFPVWTEAQALAGVARPITKSGTISLRDRRKPWQKELKTCTFSRCGSVIRMKGSGNGRPPFKMTCGTAT